MFTFTWDSQTPWLHVTDSNEWTHAIRNPKIKDTYESYYITKNQYFNWNESISFDYKWVFWNSSNWFIRFTIDGTEYLYKTRTSSGISNYDIYDHVDNLSAGNHILTWQVYWGYHLDPYLYLDNIVID
jgi:hypothetical protein